MIKIIGLGPGSPEALTLGAVELLRNSPKIYFRTEKHPTVEYIKKLNIEFNTYDYAYEKYDSFEEVYNFIAEDLFQKHNEWGDILYAVPGHPFVAEKTVNILVRLCKKNNVDVEIVPAVSFIDAIMESLRIDPVEGLKVIDAFEIREEVLDKRVGTIITQVYDKFIASEVKLILSEYYRDDTEVYFIRAAGISGEEKIKKIPIYEIDRQENIDYLTSLYIPKNEDNNKDFYDLLNIMDKLRSEDGCPWDREQTHNSLKKYLIEESYEVIEAIDENNYDKIIEELGDVLLQVVFHAAIGKEEGCFNISDIIEAICNKMIDRHPHVFGNKKVETSEEVLLNWEDIKKQEKGYATYTEELRHIAKTLPALIRAYKVQSKAAKVGFDWDQVEDAMDKVIEELNEVKDVYKGKNKAKILEEMGDLIFACVNVGRFLDVDPEEALNVTTDKFIRRFSFIEEEALKQGIDMSHMTLQDMDNLWNKSKIREKN